jgi:putative isomerase
VKEQSVSTAATPRSLPVELPNQAAINFADRIHAERAQGWNTWDTRSVLRHVLLPDGLCITLGFAAMDKLVWIDEAFFGKQELRRTPGTQLTSLDRALPTGNSLEVRPGIRTYDGKFTELELNLRGARFRVQTTSDGDNWIALVEPLQEEPWPRVLTVHVGILWENPGYAVRQTDHRIDAHLPTGVKKIYAVGTPFHDPNLPVAMPSMAFQLTEPIVVSAGTSVTLEEAQRRIAHARKTLTDLHDSFDELAEMHGAMQTGLAWNVIFEPKFQRVICPVARDWNVWRGGYAIFCWDSFLNAWMIAHDDADLGYACALEALREMPGGRFVPNVVQGSGRSSLDRSQPPVASLSFLGMHKRHANLEALRAAWPALLSWNRWWMEKRRNTKGSLSWGSDPFTPRIGDPAEYVQPNTRDGAAIESGLDNLPIYDDAPFDPETHLILTEDLALNSLYIADCLALAQIGELLGHAIEVSELTQRADQLLVKLRDLWQPELECFQDRRIDNGEWCDRRSATCFYTLLAGAATPEQASSMVEQHLLNPELFGGEWVIPAIPRTDPAFPEQIYQRGRVWPPINFLTYLGLKRYDQDAASRELAEKSLALLLKNWRSERIVAENYSAITGEGGRGPHTHPLLCWGGLLGFMALLEADKSLLPLGPKNV